MAIFFYLFASLIVISSLFVVISKNPVYSVLWLIFCFCNSAGLMILLEAEFLAMMLIIIYVGAVAVLFLFVIMMLDMQFTYTINQLKNNLPISIIIALIMFIDLVLIILLGTKHINLENTPLSLNHSELILESQKMLKQVQHDITTDTNSHAIGRVLYTDFILPFQISGIILFVAMISCITLTMRRRSGVKRQDIIKQNAKNKDNAISIVRPDFYKGITGIKYD